MATLKEEEFLFQEDVIQHPDVAAFHSNSLNTIRLNTALDSYGKAHIFAGFFRIGNGGSEVDNAYSGGYFNMHDLETGRLAEVCYSNMKQESSEHVFHRDSGMPFAGFTLPFYAEARKLAIHAAEQALPNHMIGWDIALTPFGPILIEANRLPSHMEDQALRGAYMKRPEIREMIYRLTNGKGL